MVNHVNARKKIMKKIQERKFMKIKFDSDDDLSLNKMLKLHNLILIVRSVFQEGSVLKNIITIFFR